MFQLKGIVVQARVEEMEERGVVTKFDVFSLCILGGGKPETHDFWLQQDPKRNAEQVQKLRDSFASVVGQEAQISGLLQQQDGKSVYKLKAMECRAAVASRSKAA